jgi:hypothetical protein
MERDMEINRKQKAEAVGEFLDRFKDQMPSVFYVDFVYLPTDTFYRNVGFYFTLVEAMEHAKEKIANKFNLDKKSLIYNSNLHLNTMSLMDKLIERYCDEIQETSMSGAKKISKIMNDYILAGDIGMVQKSDLNKYQKQYVIDKIIQNKEQK